MNSLVVLFVILGCAFAQYRPQPYQPGPPGHVIGIVRQNSELNDDGSYRWAYETENGISAQEQAVEKPGNPEGVKEAIGDFKYTDNEGNRFETTYIANEGGYQPQGSHLPQAPPIPPEILESLAHNEAHPEEDDYVQQQRGGGRPF